jgi:hypothetical protein
MYAKSRLASNECFPWPRVDLSAVVILLDSCQKLTQTVSHCGMFGGHTDGTHLLHSASSIRTASIRGGNRTPQVGTVTCFIPPDRADKRQTAHNRKVIGGVKKKENQTGPTLP